MVYCFPAGWIWSENGFLKTMGCVDIAGSGGVHLVGGASGIYLSIQNYSIPILNHVD